MNGYVSVSLYLLVVGFANIFWKLSAHLELDPAIYVSQGMMAGAFMLLLFSRGGKLGIETFLHLNTWLYGIFFFIGGILSIISLHFVDASVNLLLSRIGLIFTFFLTWLFITRPQRPLFQASALCTLGLGIVLLTRNIPSESLIICLICSFGLGFMDTLRALLVHTHTPNNKAKTLEEEIRIIAVVMAVTGVLSYFILLLIGAANTFGMVEPISELPEIKDLFNQKSILVASAYGIVCFSTMRYLEFYTVKRIGGLRFVAVMTFLPVSALLFEAILSKLNIIPMRSDLFQMSYAISFALIILSSLTVLFLEKGGKKLKHKASIKQKQKDASIAQFSLNHNKGDRVQTAEMLNISEHALACALGETDEDLRPEISQKLHDSFTHQMAFIDSLTGLMNRSKFINQLQSFVEREQKGVLIYIDLDKFKPINDTYGHAIGDAVLRITSQRFRQHIRGKGFASRLGGDEFACIIENSSQKAIQELIKALETPIQIDGIEEPLKVGASHGAFTLPAKDKTAEELLDIADKEMYKNKKKR